MKHDGRPIQVLMGWDRPLRGFFLVVERLDALSENESQYLYSNLDDMTLDCALPKELNHFLIRLASLRIVLPQNMLQAVLADQRENAGNKVVDHGDSSNAGSALRRAT
jgi:hypothetical protein